MRSITVPISERYYIRDDKIFQHFIYDKKYNKFISDNKLKLYEIFETKLREKSLDLLFIKRRDEEDRTVFEYEKTDEFEKPSNTYFSVFSLLPNYQGCDFCEHGREGKNGFYWCEVKQQVLPQKLRKCKFFRQKR